MKKSKSKAKIHRTHTRNNDIQTLTIRIDLERQDKADLDYLCHSLGINIQIAVRIFLAQMLQVGGLPFDVKSKEFNPDYPPETIEALQETLDIEAGKIPAKRYHSARELFEANNAEIAASENAASIEEDTASGNTASEKQSVEENAMPPAMRTPKKKIVLGVARGKYDIPADIDGCNDEIATMFGTKSNTASESYEHTPSGEFDDLILADLIKEGYEGEALLAEFRIRRAEIRPAVEKLLQQADDAAKGIGEYSTYEEVFGKR